MTFLCKFTGKTVLLLVAFLSYGQTVFGEIEAKFDVQPRVLRVGEPAECTLTVKGAKNPPRPGFPDMETFDIRYRRTSQRMEMVNFKATRSVIFSYVLLPKKAGTYQLGPYDYEVGKETVQLPAIKLEVVSGPENGSNSGSEGHRFSDMLFARFEMPREKIYSQETFPLVLKVFAQEGLNVTGNFDHYGFPESGVHLGEFRNLGRQRREIDGRIFNVYRFVTTARALASGEYNFKPGLRAGMRVERDSRRGNGFGDSFFDSFFSMGQVEMVDVPMEPLEIDIAPLPATNRPACFSGAVGDFSFSVRAQPRELYAGNPITVTMTVEGEGNIDNITAPELDLGKDFKTYESRMISSDSNGAMGGARKLFEQVVIPRNAEITELPPIRFSYFDPEKERYETITQGPFPLTVGQSTNQVVEVAASAANDDLPQAPKILGDDIVYLKEPSETAREERLFAPIEKTSFWVIHALPLLALAGVFFWRRRSELLKSNVAAARRQQAPKAARTALAHAGKALSANDPQQFYESLNAAAADYFGHRLNLAPGEVGPNEALAFCRECGLPAEAVDSLGNIFQRCEQVRFATGGAAENDLNNEGARMLDEMRAILKRCEKVRHHRGAASLRMLFAIVTACFAFGVTAVGAPQPDGGRLDRRFGKAADYYDAGKLQSALNEYQALLDNGYRNEALYFNIGNTCFRQREFGRAILFYRRAWYMDPNDPDVEANMALAIKKSGAIAPQMSIPLRIAARMSGNQWMAVATVFYWMTVLLLIVWLLAGRYRTAFRRGLYVAVLGLAVGFAGVFCWFLIADSDEAVVVMPGQEAKFAPIADSTAHFALPEGSLVHIVDRSDSWVQVESGGETGWIPKENCIPVLPPERKR